MSYMCNSLHRLTLVAFLLPLILLTRASASLIRSVMLCSWRRFFSTLSDTLEVTQTYQHEHRYKTHTQRKLCLCCCCPLCNFMYTCMHVCVRLPSKNICWNGLQVEQRICNLMDSLLSPQVWLDEGHWVHLALQAVLLGHPKDNSTKKSSWHGGPSLYLRINKAMALSHWITLWKKVCNSNMGQRVFCN